MKARLRCALVRLLFTGALCAAPMRMSALPLISGDFNASAQLQVEIPNQPDHGYPGSITALSLWGNPTDTVLQLREVIDAEAEDRLWLYYVRGSTVEIQIADDILSGESDFLRDCVKFFLLVALIALIRHSERNDRAA